jgi:acetylornithine aminotransferase
VGRSLSTSTEGQPYPGRDETIETFAAHVNRGKAEALKSLGVDIVMGEREGARFRDAYSGRWYWNCHCNGGVFNLGHRHPRVVAALRDALDHLDVGNHHLISGWRARVAERLAESTGERLPYAMFTPSGSEAVDLAIRLARACTGREKVVSALGSFHGLAGLGWAAGDPRWVEPFGFGPPGFSHVPFNDAEAMRERVSGDTAAIIIEAIPATLGFPPPEPGYMVAVASMAREHGALLILDEVQTGLGRTGTTWYWQQEEIAPDIVITGKGLGGGLYPISAALLRADLEEFFDRHPFAYVSSFGGAELGCVVAGAVLDEVLERDFLARVREVGERFETGFAGLPFELRRRGLTMGLRFEQAEGGVAAAKRLIDAGVFAVFAEHDHRVTQFKPPLIVSDEEADEIIAAVSEALA